ncbi:MAG: F-type H+-transporting ATPase subunit gamma [bacterium]|jgi:F-type H+-transporting ATPase subunit gamma
MASLKDIRNRISSVKNTQQITRAMKMVSAAKLRRAEEAIKAARPYALKLREISSRLGQGLDRSSHPLLAEREGGKAVIILVTSDKGLCGGLNVNLCKKVARLYEEKKDEFDNISLVCFGKKGGEYFKSRGIEIKESYRDLKDSAQAEVLATVIQGLTAQYQKGEINRVYVAYNSFLSILNQEPTTQQVLPLEAFTEEEDSGEQSDFLFEPSKDDILNTILPKYVENQGYSAILENVASEHGSRMTSMDAATNNAGDMIARLQLQYNRARQASITKELIEIVSGAESLN